MMVSTMIDSEIFRDWFGSQEMREVFTDARVAFQLGPEKIDDLLNPEKYTGLSEEVADRLTGRKAEAS